MPPEAHTAATRELKRLRRIPPQSVEHNVIRSYLDWMVALPWGRSSATGELDRAFLDRARKQLEDDHYGLDKVKKRLLEYLAVLRLKTDLDKAEQAHEEALRRDERAREEAARPDVKVLGDALQGRDPEIKSLESAPVRDEQDSDAAAYAAFDQPQPVTTPVVPEKKPKDDKQEDVPAKGRTKGPILCVGSQRSL